MPIQTMADYIDNNSCHIDQTADVIDEVDILGTYTTMQEHQSDEIIASSSIDKDDTVCLLAPSKATSTKASARNDLQNAKEKRQLIMATSLCFVFMFAEIVGGYIAGSLAIMSDAAHLLSDCISFIVALMAICLSKKSPDNYMTFGYKRVEVLGAIISILGIWILTTFLFYFALNRMLYQDFDIDADTMIIVSLIGIFINIFMAIILHGDGLCWMPHTHTHSHGHGCSPQKHEQHSYHNNNKTKSEYKLLINEPMTVSRTKSVLMNGGNGTLQSSSARTNRSNSICSYRSPNHSRANSFSTVDVLRRNSHVTPLNGETKRDSLGCDANQRESVNLILNDDKSTLNQDVLRCIFDGSSICPLHNYVHRDSSENTPASSDSEELHHRSHAHGSHHHDHAHDFASKNINIQAAVIHVLGDFIQSIGVFVSAVIIKYYPDAKIADPLCTFVFSIIVMMTTCTIMKDSIGIILESVPNSISTERLAKDLRCIDGVRSVHSLNVWSLTVGHNVMSVHIITDPFANAAEVLYIATTVATKGYNIKQCTIQIESISAFDTASDAIEQNHNHGKTQPINVNNDNSDSIISILA